MAEQNKRAEAALTKLGERVRAGWAKKHPISERSLETVRTATREVWEQEQKAKRRTVVPKTPPKSKTKGRDIEPDV
jgi:hypothetical protein